MTIAVDMGRKATKTNKQKQNMFIIDMLFCAIDITCSESVQYPRKDNLTGKPDNGWNCSIQLVDQFRITFTSRRIPNICSEEISRLPLQSTIIPLNNETQIVSLVLCFESSNDIEVDRQFS